MTDRNRSVILCVDDEALGLYFRKLILERQGYEVITASNAPEGLRLFGEHPIGLVVTDHLLGRDIGTAMAAEMKAHKPDVPILVLSGTTDLPQGLQHADAFLSKTDGPAQFLAKVGELLATGRDGGDGSRDSAAVTQRDEGVGGGRDKEPKLSSTESSSDALLAAIVEGSTDAILSKMLDGTITSWNKAAQSMYGYTAEEAIGQGISLILPPDRKTEFENIVARLLRGEQIESFETERIAKDGSLVNVYLTVSPIRDSGGRVVGTSTISRDITQLKLAEDALRNSEKLAVAGRMAATVAHEINNPLEAVGNILYLLENSENLDLNARQFVWAAQEELKRIAQITRLTLGFYRGDRKETDVHIPDLIENVLTLYGRKIESLGIKVITNYEGTPVIRGDEGEFRQVFSNLVVNAVDAMNESGDRLWLHVFDSRDWRNPGKTGVRTTVCDNGRGIPAEHRRRLFEPFYTTKGAKGTGIGLWVSRGIVQKHGGSLRFRTSTEPRRSGTTFSVFLPRKSETAAN